VGVGLLWIRATRPKTLVASIAPVLIGSALCFANNTMQWWMMPWLLTSAVLIQITSNFSNEVEDAKRGADANRIGPIRAVASGLITPQSMRRAVFITACLAFILGVPLIVASGATVLVIGSVCLLLAYLYTGGPFPLAYHGLGDAFAFLCFGVVAVAGTVYVHSGVWTIEALVVSVGPGFLAANILGVNNMRDVETDRAVGKHTLAVRIGVGNARLLYTVQTMFACIVPPVFLATRHSPFVLAPMATLPLGIMLCCSVYKARNAEYNNVLASTAMLYVLYALMMCLGLALSTL
jgi:1,4-dihydroxy-2-naphthoate polyprenyltransferase